MEAGILILPICCLFLLILDNAVDARTQQAVILR
jgi:hypothetical protein